MGIKLAATSGGSIELVPTNTASNFTVTVPAATGTMALTSQVTGMRNRIINGAMVIDQRNAGASVTPTTSGSAFAVDRWQMQVTQNSKMTGQQNAGSVTPPAGYTGYMGVTSSSAYSIVSTDFFLLSQAIEANNIADFGWGGANAVSATLSFWVRSSLTGTFGGSIENSTDRSFPFSFTINAANTWEQKTVLIPAPSAGGTWGTGNATGVFVRFGLGVGSTYNGTAGAWASLRYFSATGATSVVGTSGATFYITGVQLEAGTTATPFENRLYGTELALCQRYYWKKVGGASGSSYEPIATGVIYNTTTNVRVNVVYPVPARAIPTFSTSGTLYVAVGGGNLTPSTITSYAGLNSAMLDVAVTSSTLGNGAVYYTSNTSSDYFQASAEL